MTTSTRHTAKYLQQISRKLFAASGAPDDIAATVAEILVNANLAGHDSHGVQFVPMYLDRIEDGGIVHTAYPEIVRESANTMHVDGHKGFGHYMSRQAMEWAIERARRSAVCCVTFQNTTHIGRVGEYAEQAAKGWLHHADNTGRRLCSRVAGRSLRRRTRRSGHQSNCSRHSHRRRRSLRD